MTDTTSYRSTRVWAALLSVGAAGVMLWAFYLIFFWVPTEAEQGVVQRLEEFVRTFEESDGRYGFVSVPVLTVGFAA